MATIPIEAEVSSEQLLRAVAQLPSQDFAAFVNSLLALRAERAEPRLSQPETALLLQINQGIPDTTRRRGDELVAKRQMDAIAPEELAELVEITNGIERLDAQRLTALDALARLRRISLGDLMDTLRLRPPTHG